MKASGSVGYRDYGFHNEGPSHMHALFVPPLIELCKPYIAKGTRVLDVGCGNGALAGVFLELGCDVVGIDLSETGIELARRAYPVARFEVLSADEHILQRLQSEPFDVVVSTEVVEHLYDPRSYVAGCYKAIRPGGRFVCSTPYHGYIKNLAISLVGSWDRHMNPLWDGGHIKLWSRRTLSQLLLDSGLRDLQFRGVGRFPFLWMTMLMSADKPEE